jgi:hypothetical protein
VNVVNHAPLDKFRPMVVVVSTGRTGTQALAHHLDASYANVTALHEPRPSRHLRLMSNRAVAGAVTMDEAVAELTRSRAKLFAGVRTPVYVESNWYVYGLLEALPEVFGRVKVLHVVRDPKTYIPSGLNFGQFSGLRALATTFLPYWYLKPEDAPRELGPDKPWAQMTGVERLAWHWHVVNGEIDRVSPLFGQDFLRIRYEDVFGRDATGLGKLLEWIGLPDDAGLRERMQEKKVNASTTKRRCAPWKDWSDEQRAAVLARCGARMRAYGYDV